MTDINKVMISGRITRDAELRYTNSQTAVASFTVAVNRSVKRGDQWEDEASFIDCSLWGKYAEAVSGRLVKGLKVAVSGELRQSSWEKDGQKRSRITVVADNIAMFSGDASGAGANKQPASAIRPDDDIHAEPFNDDGIPF